MFNFANKRRNFAGAILVLVSLVLICYRNAGLPPQTFADEWIYHREIFQIPFEQASRPLFFFYKIYKFCEICGDNFLACSRYLNVFFFFLSNLFIYKIARKFLEEENAFIVSILSCFLPFNTFSLYLMPESLNYLLFFVSFYFFISFVFEKKYYKLYLSFFTMGLMSLVKPHILFILPVFLGVVYLVSQKKLLYIVLPVIIFLGVRFLLAFMFTGEFNLNFFGQNYSTHTEGFNLINFFSQKTNLFLISFVGFSSATAILMPFVLNVYRVKAIFLNLTSSEKYFYFLFFGMLFSLIIILSLFSALVSSSGPYENVTRISFRHMGYLFPLSLILTFRQEELISKYKIYFDKTKNLIFVFIYLSCFLIYYFKYRAAVNQADSPELFSMFHSDVFFILPILIFILTFCILFYEKFFILKRIKLNLISYVVIPLLIISCFVPTVVKSNFVYNSIFDDVPQKVKKLVSFSDCNLTILSNDLAGLYRSSYYFNIPMSNMRFIKDDEHVRINDLYTCTEYILFFGNFIFDKKVDFILRSEPNFQHNWALVRVLK